MSYRDEISLFKECSMCAAKTGSPVLCESCFHNRGVIEKLQKGGIMENKVKPIKPEDITAEKAKFIPDEVFKAFNTLIARNWNGSSSTFKQDEVVNMIVGFKCFEDPEHEKLFRRVIYDQHMLDVEDIYREQGWKVYYDKPAYNETYAATFCFSKK